YIDGIRCYNCVDHCPDPFNKTSVLSLESLNRWSFCMKLKALKPVKFMLVRSFTSYDLCTENKFEMI
ncbi:unnamed protein product, partial [Rotaria socialis]